MKQSYLDQFTDFSGADGKNAPEWVRVARRNGIERFAELGFPSTKNEDWHFTSVAPIAERAFTLGARRSGVVPSDLSAFKFGQGWHSIVFVNGMYAPDLSSIAGLDAGVQVLSLAEAFIAAPDLASRVGSVLSDPGAFSALNSAFMANGMVVRIPKDVTLRDPIHCIFVSDDSASGHAIHPRNLIVAERNSKATVVESYVALGDASYFTNAVTEVVVGDGATLEHYKIQREGRRAFHVGTVEATQGRDSHFVSFSFATGGSLTRSNIYTRLAGEGCGATLNGLYMLDGEQHSDHQTRIEHVAPNCFSREIYKGVLDERSHGVFNGKVYVHPEAQKTDGKQTNNTLLLSKDAQVDTKPQLEIFADDVKCTHGATVGKLDEIALFYMKSRGMNAEAARRLLIYAFCADVLETIEQPDVRDGLERVALERFVTSDELVAA